MNNLNVLLSEPPFGGKITNKSRNYQIIRELSFHIPSAQPENYLII